MKNLILAALTATTLAAPAHATSGGLDQNGCHMDHKGNAGYHCHRAQPVTPEPQLQPTYQQQPLQQNVNANNNDIGLLILGIIAGAAITDNHQPAPEPNWNNHRPRREHRQPRDWNTVCGYQTEYQHNWIITTGTNCYGEVVSVERRRR